MLTDVTAGSRSNLRLEIKNTAPSWISDVLQTDSICKNVIKVKAFSPSPLRTLVGEGPALPLGVTTETSTKDHNAGKDMKDIIYLLPQLLLFQIHCC